MVPSLPKPCCSVPSSPSAPHASSSSSWITEQKDAVRDSIKSLTKIQKNYTLCCVQVWPNNRNMSSIGPTFLDNILLITFNKTLAIWCNAGKSQSLDWPFMSSPCINESQLCTLPVKPWLSFLAAQDHTVSSFPWASRGLSWPAKLVLSSACLTYDTTELTAPVLLKGVLKDWPAFVDSWDLKSILLGYSISSFLNSNTLNFALLKFRVTTLLSWKWMEISYFGR